MAKLEQQVDVQNVPSSFSLSKKNGINKNSMDMDCYEMSNVLKQNSKTCHFMSWLNSLSLACYGMSVIATPY